MRSRAIAVLVMFALAACERATSPVSPTRFSSYGPSLHDNNTVMQNQTIDISGTVVSPCTGEAVVFQGSAHIVATFEPTIDGFTVTSHFNTQGVTGVGVETGTKYQFSEVSNVALTATSDPLSGSATVNTNFRVISAGSTDNFLLDAIYTFTFPPPAATYKMQNARCVG